METLLILRDFILLPLLVHQNLSQHFTISHVIRVGLLSGLLYLLIIVCISTLWSILRWSLILLVSTLREVWVVPPIWVITVPKNLDTHLFGIAHKVYSLWISSTEFCGVVSFSTHIISTIMLLFNHIH